MNIIYSAVEAAEELGIPVSSFYRYRKTIPTPSVESGTGRRYYNDRDIAAIKKSLRGRYSQRQQAAKEIERNKQSRPGV
jgi:DNA-binding transcriptional MerR regulator